MKKFFLILIAVACGACEGFSQVATNNYVASEKLTFKGFATPEDTVQSAIWMSMNTNREAILTTSLPELNATHEMSREYFESSKEYARKSFAGFQILTKKQIETNLVELTLLRDSLDVKAPRQILLREYYVVTLTKIGTDWKFAKDTRKLNNSWNQNRESNSAESDLKLRKTPHEQK